jgi:hypothetical protein
MNFWLENVNIFGLLFWGRKKCGSGKIEIKTHKAGRGGAYL